jgi:hypothetical protein
VRQRGLLLYVKKVGGDGTNPDVREYANYTEWDRTVVKVKEILLTRGAVAKVDDEDYGICSVRRWWLTSDGYARARFYYEQVGLHVFVMRLHHIILPGHVVDHLNGDRLDCQKSNLRICTRSQNNHNRAKRRDCSSRFIGVTKARRNTWAVYFNGGRVCGGYKGFEGEFLAALHYDWLAQQRGHANLNFPARYSEAVIGKDIPLTLEIMRELIRLSFAVR